jgi:hypothetical protein
MVRLKADTTYVMVRLKADTTYVTVRLKADTTYNACGGFARQFCVATRCLRSATMRS